MVLLGFNFAEMEKDMYDQILTRAQIRDMYGPTGNIAVIGWNKQMLTKICQKSLNLHVKKMTEKCPLLNRFKHYLLTLSGHSGCGISIKPREICAIHVGTRRNPNAIYMYTNKNKKKMKQHQKLAWASSEGSFLDTILEHI